MNWLVWVQRNGRVSPQLWAERSFAIHRDGERAVIGRVEIPPQHRHLSLSDVERLYDPPRPVVMSFPKAVQVLRDHGGRARRLEWDDRDYLTLGPVPWNGEQEALLHHRPSDRRQRAGKESVVIFLPFGEDVRALDWSVESSA